MQSLIKYRVVIDTNVFISAILKSGNPEKIVTLWRQGRIHLLLSPFLAAEILSVMNRFGITSTYIQELTYRLEHHTIQILPASPIALCRDPKDNEILSLAVDGSADYIITGDNDLLTLGKIERTMITKPKDFLQVINPRRAS